MINSIPSLFLLSVFIVIYYGWQIEISWQIEIMAGRLKSFIEVLITTGTPIEPSHREATYALFTSNFELYLKLINQVSEL